ncbi:hypothetical protein KZP23_15735 [Echinicola marina]|uniref:hypothetical protein n=1 Tax=Echinicola marina TaxID=2859768 RepID=UPI001CF6D4CA|nr:hypothetical protein [Echinicola marina]UCS92151.1 hypothetical protein KZP23_15735 [Echinicola marina]
MAKLYEIDSWSEQLWWNTGGTRDKKIYQNPEDGTIYYFKQSYRKGKMDYQHEFWSEIIAYEVGEFLGFDVLPYHIALRNEVVGCISKSMIDPESEELVEGGKYLQAFDHTFKPEDSNTRSRYNFDLIIKALSSFDLPQYTQNIINIIVFDALIGNSDRHQENWAVINEHSMMTKTLSEVRKDYEKDQFKAYPYIYKKIYNFFYTKKGKIRKEVEHAQLMLPKETRFAQIYDSGCCFGRELLDEKVSILLRDDKALNKYIDKGKSEIHWEGKKVNHFELVTSILEDEELKPMVLKSLEEMVKRFDKKKIEQIVNNIDQELVKMGNPKILPTDRKEMIIKLLILRFRKLEAIYQSNK